MEVSQAERLKDLEKENAHLKKIVADQVLGLEILKEALEKEAVSLGHKRQIAKRLIEESRCTQRQACQRRRYIEDISRAVTSFTPTLFGGGGQLKMLTNVDEFTR